MHQRRGCGVYENNGGLYTGLIQSQCLVSVRIRACHIQYVDEFCKPIHSVFGGELNLFGIMHLSILPSINFLSFQG